MTSIPASRRARAMIFAPRSWPSSPGFATTTRILRAASSLMSAGSVAPLPLLGAESGERPGQGKNDQKDHDSEREKAECQEGSAHALRLVVDLVELVRVHAHRGVLFIGADLRRTLRALSAGVIGQGHAVARTDDIPASGFA